MAIVQKDRAPQMAVVMAGPASSSKPLQRFCRHGRRHARRAGIYHRSLHMVLQLWVERENRLKGKLPLSVFISRG